MLPEELEIFYLHKTEYIHGTWVINDAGRDKLVMSTLSNRKGPRASSWPQGQILAHLSTSPAPAQGLCADCVAFN